MTTNSSNAVKEYAASLAYDPEPVPVATDQYANLRQQPPHAARIHAKLTPLVDRLRQKLAEVPPEDREWGVKMSAVWSMCSGVQRSKPPAWAVGQALRDLGYTRYRLYSDGAEPSTTWWVPPGVDIEQAKLRIRERKQ